MITLTIFLSLLFQVTASCPTLCKCQNNIVTCVQSLLETVPSGLPSSTRVLNLSSNRLQSLSETSFAGLHDLEEIYIESNHITKVHRDTFRNNVRLKVLNLRNNNLNELSESLFDYNNVLTTLDVSDNPLLTHIPYQLIQNNYALKSLTANTVNCDCSMSSWRESLRTYQMDDVEITITCFNPSNYRGYRIEVLPDQTFEECTSSSTSLCAPDEMLCDGSTCLQQSLVCDGNYDCYDGQDETDCATVPPQIDCEGQEDVFMCDNGECVYKNWVCDTYNDCGDMSDERDCSNSGNEVVLCEDQFECSNGRCVNRTARCDGYNDCGDWSDESKLVCGDIEAWNVCPAGYWLCGTEGGCIEHTQLCDNVPDCPDSSDENNCFGNCTSKCESDGRCIKDTWICDKIRDCADGSDEANCDYTCDVGEVKCSGCVSCALVCDGFNDCVDQLDETSCSICNGTMCLELEQTKSGVTTIVIIATTVSACISITSVVLFVLVYRQRRKASSRDSLQPPLYTEIDHSFRSDVPGTPPPRYKSEPDIAARLMSVENTRNDPHNQFRQFQQEI